MKLRPDEDVEFTLEPEAGISGEDQKDILAEIEKVATESRIAVTPEIFTIKAIKKGTLFPIMVNLFSIIILAAGIFTFYLLFQRGETSLMKESTAITSAEGMLIEELKKESEAKLLEKNREISLIQTRLQAIDREREDLQTNMEARIQERELQLLEILDSELEVERARLRERGVSEEEIGRIMAQFESEKSAEYNEQLETFRKETEEERIRSENNLKALREEYSSNLVVANMERQKVLEESKKREEELKIQLAEKTEALESEKLQARQELERISEQREKEQLANSQLIGLYNGVKENIQAGELDQALLDLNNIRDFLNEEAIVTLSGMLERREVELFVVDSINSLVKNELEKEEVDTASLIASANLVTEIKNMVLEAERLSKRGETGEAEKKYEEALSIIPEISRSHDFFLARQEEAEEERQKRLKEYLTRAETAFAGKNYQAALDNYTRALEYLPEDAATIEKMIARTRQSGFELGEDRLVRRDTEKAAGLLSEAERLFARRQYNEAILAYLDIVAKYPRSSQVKSALTGINKAVEAKNETALNNMTGLQDKNRELNGTIEALKGEIEELRRSSASSPARVTELDEATKNKLDRLVELERKYNVIKESYAQYAAREDSILKSQGEAGLLESKLYLNDFLSSTEEIFPGLWDRIKKYDRAFEQAGRSGAMQHVVNTIYTLSSLSGAGEREQFLDGEKAGFRDDPIMIELLDELKELVKP